MTTASGCARKCRLHTKFDWHLPCRNCESSHPASRSAHGQPPAVLRGSAEDNRGLTEAQDASPDPALTAVIRTVREPRARVRAGSPLQRRGVEPVAPPSGSASALSGSRRS